MQFQPIVKWSGSKRSQAEAIVARMPKEIDTYYEPFCGGCSVLYRLLHTHSVHVEMVSFNGRTDKEDLTYKVPQDIYVSHEYLNSGNSSFRRVIGNDRHANVEESLYCNFVPEKECLLF